MSKPFDPNCEICDQGDVTVLYEGNEYIIDCIGCNPEAQIEAQKEWAMQVAMALDNLYDVINLERRDELTGEIELGSIDYVHVLNALDQNELQLVYKPRDQNHASRAFSDAVINDFVIPEK